VLTLARTPIVGALNAQRAVVTFLTEGGDMADVKDPTRGERNEGEGNKTADKQYRERATDYAKKHDTMKEATDAERDVENYRDEYESAERAGKSHSAGDTQNDLSGKTQKR
jgi:hypothetical protein